MHCAPYAVARTAAGACSTGAECVVRCALRVVLTSVRSIGTRAGKCTTWTRLAARAPSWTRASSPLAP
eukprot:1137520-Rhodomonas_salina.1